MKASYIYMSARELEREEVLSFLFKTSNKHKTVWSKFEINAVGEIRDSIITFDTYMSPTVVDVGIPVEQVGPGPVATNQNTIYNPSSKLYVGAEVSNKGQHMIRMLATSSAALDLVLKPNTYYYTETINQSRTREGWVGVLFQWYEK